MEVSTTEILYISGSGKEIRIGDDSSIRSSLFVAFPFRDLVHCEAKL